MSFDLSELVWDTRRIKSAPCKDLKISVSVKDERVTLYFAEGGKHVRLNVVL
jgi:hypothetical protein